MTRTIRLLISLAVTLTAAGLMTPAAHADQAGSSVRGFQAGLLDSGFSHSCTVTTSNAVRCWGNNGFGLLGLGNTEDIGDDEPASAAGNTPVGAAVRAIAAGGNHTCALLTTSSVRCWGNNSDGTLGFGDGNPDTVGDDEPASARGNVPVGGPVAQISAGSFHTCVLLTTGNVRCWGTGFRGRLGYGNTDIIGDDETPASVGDVPLGGTAKAIAAGDEHTCALMSGGAVRCWGYNVDGRLGYGSTANVGDDEPAGSAGDVPLGGTAVAISAGSVHTCALMTTGAVRCWGSGANGVLGYGNTDAIGDDEPASAAGNVPIGGTATAVSAGGGLTCAVMSTGAVRCWGFNNGGQLGYGNTASIGDDEPPSAAGDVPIGAGPVVGITTGGQTACALLASGRLRCWGFASVGRLGYGNTNDVGDDEPASAAGDVPLGALLHGVVSDVSLAVAAPSAATTGVPYAATVSVTNAGPDAVTGLTVSAPGLSGAASRGTYDPDSGIWTVGTLAAGQSATLTLTRRGDAAGAQSLVAEVQAAGVFDLDSAPGNGLATEDDRAIATTTVSDPPPVVAPPVITPPAVTPPATPPAATRVRGRLSVTAKLRPRSRKARISGKLVLPVGTSRTFCSGSVKVSLLRGTRAIATGTAKLKRPARGRTCTFATTVTLKKKARLVRRQKLKVSARVVQTTRLARVTKRVTRTVPRR